MGWSPEHHIGVIALGNHRYSGFSQTCADSLTQMIKKFELVSASRMPSAALQNAYNGINSLFEKWDDELADTLFADNFFLDLDRPHRKAELDQLRERHGNLQAIGALEPEDWLRGKWRLHGERGWYDVFVSMTPTVPPLVQTLNLGSVMPLSADMQAMLHPLAELITQPTLAKLDELRGDGSNRKTLWENIQLAHLICGGGTMDQVIGSNGLLRALVMFKGEKADAKVVIKLDQIGKLAMVRFLSSENSA
jgi:hypothetical protein